MFNVVEDPALQDLFCIVVSSQMEYLSCGVSVEFNLDYDIVLTLCTCVVFFCFLFIGF